MQLLIPVGLPRYGCGDKELRAVRVLACICHAQKTLLGVLQFEVLVCELVSIDRLSASAIALGKVSSLDHEVLDDTVEIRAFVAKTLLAGR